MKPRRKEVILAVSCLMAVVLITADPSDASEEYFYGGHLSAVGGSVWIQSAYDSELTRAEMNLLVEEGTRVATARDGRAEIQLSGNHVLRLWHDTEVDFVGVEEPAEIWMKLGSIYVRTTPQGGEDYVQKIVTPTSTVYVPGNTILRMDVESEEITRVAVLEGNAEVFSGRDSLLLHPRQMTTVGVTRIYGPVRLSTAPGDGFVRWCNEREEILASPLDPRSPRVDGPAVSELEPYGSWVYVPELSVRVWRPRVAVGWSPYHHGRWTWSVRYGLFWISNEPWGWIPYHYGSWSWYASCGWVWVPGSVWHGARVSWVVSGDFIGWRPLLYSSSHITVHIPAKQHPYYFVHRSSITDRHTRSVQLDNNHLARHRTVVLKDPNSIVSPPNRVRRTPDRPAVTGSHGQRRAEHSQAVERHTGDPGSRSSRRSGLQERGSGERFAGKRSETTEHPKGAVARQGQDSGVKRTGVSRGPASGRTATSPARDAAVKPREPTRAYAGPSRSNRGTGVSGTHSRPVTSGTLKGDRRNTPTQGTVSARRGAGESTAGRDLAARVSSSARQSSGNRGEVRTQGNASERSSRGSRSTSTGSHRASTQRGRR